MLEYLQEHTHLEPNTYIITIGNFDGVHLGHRFLIDEVIQKAQALGKKSLVIIFSPHPREVLRGQKVPLINTIDEKHQLLSDLGIDLVIVLPFTKQVASIPAKQFLEDVLIGQLGMAGLILGYDHSFGKDREASDESLAIAAAEHGFVFERQVAVKADEEIISSSKIRDLLLDGSLEKANSALGRPYSLSGTVVEGHKRGRRIGFPTANLSVGEKNKVIPGNGVYAVKGKVEGYFEADGMLNIGVRPSFDDGEERSIETFFFDSDLDLYGKELSLTIYKKLRDELKFDSLEELKNQLAQDEDDCIKYFKSLS